MAGSILAALKLIFFDYTMDEEYQLMMGYRTLRGMPCSEKCGSPTRLPLSCARA